MIALEEFLELPTVHIAELVRGSGPKVCVFPINGTRRWFILEHGNAPHANPIQAYMDLASQNHIRLYKLFFDHGIDTLLTPEIGGEILETRDGYMQKIGAEGLARFARHAEFLAFYQDYDVHVRFYGDYRNKFNATPYEHLSDLFDEINEKTSRNTRFRLLIGAFADDPMETIADLIIRYFKETGRIPDGKTIIELYYGEPIESANLFIGFDRFSVFDYPLLGDGREDLYFTAAPSPYMNQKQLRKILYDHLFTRRQPEPEYEQMTSEELLALRSFYRQNQENAIGVGKLANRIWTPDIG
jgi:adenosine tuberculosinyltransferase